MMKKKLLKSASIVLLSLLLSSCASEESPSSFEIKEVTVVIKEVYEAKYSVVKGYAYYNNILLPIHNGGTGYYHKEYRLGVGDSIKRKIVIRKKYRYDGITITVDPVSFDDYEVFRGL